MDIEATKTAATQLLDNYYQIHTSDLPTQRPKSQWQASSPIVNEKGFYCRVRLDENGLPPFAELQDDTKPTDKLDDDCCGHKKYWDVKNPEDILRVSRGPRRSN